MDNDSTDVLISAQRHGNFSLPDWFLFIKSISGWKQRVLLALYSSCPEMSEPCGGAVAFHVPCMSCVCVVFLSPYRQAAGQVLSGQDTPLPEHPCSKCPWLSTQEAWLTTLWHAAMLASMQRKSTNSISLIRAFGISPSKPWWVCWVCSTGLCLVWPGPSWWLCGTEGRDRWVPKHPLSHPNSYLSMLSC